MVTQSMTIHHKTEKQDISSPNINSLDYMNELDIQGYQTVGSL